MVKNDELVVMAYTNISPIGIRVQICQEAQIGVAMTKGLISLNDDAFAGFNDHFATKLKKLEEAPFDIIIMDAL